LPDFLNRSAEPLDIARFSRIGTRSKIGGENQKIYPRKHAG